MSEDEIRATRLEKVEQLKNKNSPQLVAALYNKDMSINIELIESKSIGRRSKK